MMDKPEIEYPCAWPYKIIGANREVIIDEIAMLLAGKSFELRDSHQSKQGTYSSFNLIVNVYSEAERDKIFQALGQIPTVKIVI